MSDFPMSPPFVTLFVLIVYDNLDAADGHQASYGQVVSTAWYISESSCRKAGDAFIREHKDTGYHCLRTNQVPEVIPVTPWSERIRIEQRRRLVPGLK